MIFMISKGAQKQKKQNVNFEEKFEIAFKMALTYQVHQRW